MAGDGNDTLDGGAGEDRLMAAMAMITLLGGAGTDWLDGGTVPTISMAAKATICSMAVAAMTRLLAAKATTALNGGSR